MLLVSSIIITFIGLLIRAIYILFLKHYSYYYRFNFVSFLLLNGDYISMANKCDVSDIRLPKMVIHESNHHYTYT